MHKLPHVIRPLKSRFITLSFDGSHDVEAIVLKVRKSASLVDIYFELANQYSVGERCSCKHDCCGCIRYRILSLKPIKRGEVYLKLQSARNV